MFDDLTKEKILTKENAKSKSKLILVGKRSDRMPYKFGPILRLSTNKYEALYTGDTYERMLKQMENNQGSFAEHYCDRCGKVFFTKPSWRFCKYEGLCSECEELLANSMNKGPDIWECIPPWRTKMEAPVDSSRYYTKNIFMFE